MSLMQSIFLQEHAMLKIIATGATALTLVAGAAAYAQQPSVGPGFGRQQFGAEDRAAFLDARISALHAGLRLTPEQDKAWPAFEQAYRDLAATRGDRSSDPRTEQPLDPGQRAQRNADALAARSTVLKRYADAVTPLYQSLDDNQKRRFGILSRMERRMERPRFRDFTFWHGGDRGEFRSLR
jgi:zinc resistance-associated protein